MDLISGASAIAGQIHDQVPFGGVVIHDSGLLRFDGNGNLTFEAGRTRDSAVTPLRFTSSAQHCPDLKQARQAKLQRAL